MKAFKGCTNVECKSYKKVHYNQNDQFCLRCGSALSFVCSDCWKVLSDNKKRLCIGCEAEKDQKRARNAEAVKENGMKVIAAVGMVATVAVSMARDTEKIADSVKKVANAGAKVVKLIKK